MKLKHAFKRIHQIEQLEAALRDNPDDKELESLVEELKNLNNILFEFEKRFRKKLEELGF